MANETDSDSLTEMINSEWIDPVLQDYSREFVNATRFTLKRSLIGKGTSTWAKPRFVSDMGTVGDGGTGVATAYDATEGTDPGDTTLETTEATISTSEYGVIRKITDTLMEDMIDGFDLLSAVAKNGMEILETAKEDDLIGNFSSLTNATSDTGNDITLSDVRVAIGQIRNRGVRATRGGLVGIVSDTQMGDLEADGESVGSNDVVYPHAAAEVLNVRAAEDNGLMDGLVLVIKGVPFYQSGLVDTVNTNADDSGAIFVRGDIAVQEGFACFGQAVSREFRLETARGAEGATSRSTFVVMTERAGFGILQDDAGQELIFDA